jgi:uncharacterized membrane protein
VELSVNSSSGSIVGFLLLHRSDFLQKLPFIGDCSSSLRMQCNSRIALLSWLIEMVKMVRERHKSTRKARIDALARRVGKRLFIATAVIAIVLLLVLFLKPETFEVDDGPQRFGGVEKAVPRNTSTEKTSTAR